MLRILLTKMFESTTIRWTTFVVKVKQIQVIYMYINYKTHYHIKWLIDFVCATSSGKCFMHIRDDNLSIFIKFCIKWVDLNQFTSIPLYTIDDSYRLRAWLFLSQDASNSTCPITCTTGIFSVIIHPAQLNKTPLNWNMLFCGYGQLYLVFRSIESFKWIKLIFNFYTTAKI